MDQGDKFKEKLKAGIEDAKNSPYVQDAIRFAKTNQGDTAAYIVLILGILISFASPIIGGALVGAIVGIYFANEIIYLIKHAKDFIETRGIVKGIVLAGTALLLFFSLPTLFIAVAGAVALKWWLFS